MAKEKTSKTVAEKASWLLGKKARGLIGEIQQSVPMDLANNLDKYRKYAEAAAGSALTQRELDFTPKGMFPKMRPGSKVEALMIDLDAILNHMQSQVTHGARRTAEPISKIALELQTIMIRHGWEKSNIEITMQRHVGDRNES